MIGETFKQVFFCTFLRVSLAAFSLWRKLKKTFQLFIFILRRYSYDCCKRDCYVYWVKKTPTFRDYFSAKEKNEQLLKGCQLFEFIGYTYGSCVCSHGVSNWWLIAESMHEATHKIDIEQFSAVWWIFVKLPSLPGLIYWFDYVAYGIKFRSKMLIDSLPSSLHGFLPPHETSLSWALSVLLENRKIVPDVVLFDFVEVHQSKIIELSKYEKERNEQK